MNISSIFILGISVGFSALNAQDLMVIGGFRNSVISSTDSITAYTTLGNPVGGTTVQNGIMVTTDLFPIHIIIDTTTTLKGLEKIEGIRIFPNPTPNIIVLQRTDIHEDLIVQIFSSDGIPVKSLSWMSGIGTLQPSFESFASGIYFLLVTNQESSKGNQYKILKQ